MLMIPKDMKIWTNVKNQKELGTLCQVDSPSLLLREAISSSGLSFIIIFIIIVAIIIVVITIIIITIIVIYE